MKLHLPSALRGALLACFAVACTVPAWADEPSTYTSVTRKQIYEDGVTPPEPPVITADFQTDETTAGVLSAIPNTDTGNFEGSDKWEIQVSGVITKSADTTKDTIILTNAANYASDTFDPTKKLKSGQFMLVLTQQGEIILFNSNACSSEEESSKGTMATYWTVGNLGSTDWTTMKFSFNISSDMFSENDYAEIILDANKTDAGTLPSYLYLYDAAGNQLLTNVTASGNDSKVLQFGWADVGDYVDRTELLGGMYTRLPENSYISLGSPAEMPAVDDLLFPVPTILPLEVNWYLVNGSTATVEGLREGKYADYDSKESAMMLDTETIVFCGGTLATEDYTKATTVTLNNALEVEKADTNITLAPGTNATLVITNGEQALTPGILDYTADGKFIEGADTAVPTGRLIIGGAENSKVVLQNVTTTTLTDTTVQAGAALELAGDASSVYTIDLSNTTLEIADAASLGVSGGSTLDLIAKTDGSSKLNSLTGSKGLIRLHNTLQTTTVNTDGLTILEGSTLTVNGDGVDDTTDFKAGAVTIEKGTTLTVTGRTSAGKVAIGEGATVSLSGPATTGALTVGKDGKLICGDYLIAAGITTAEDATITAVKNINANGKNLVLGTSSSMVAGVTIAAGALTLQEGTDAKKTTAESQFVYVTSGDLTVKANASLTTGGMTVMYGDIIINGAEDTSKAGSIAVTGDVSAKGVQLNDGGKLTIDAAGSLSTSGKSTIDGGQIQYGDILVEAASTDTTAEFTALSVKGSTVKATSASNASIQLTAAGDSTISLGNASGTDVSNTSGNMSVSNTSFSNGSTLTVTDGALALKDSAISADSKVSVTGTGAAASFSGTTGLTLADGASITVGDSTFTATNAQSGVSITGKVEKGVLTLSTLSANIRHLREPETVQFILHDDTGNSSINKDGISYTLIYAPGMAGDVALDADGHLVLCLRDDSAAIVESLSTSENATAAVNALWDGYMDGARDEIQYIFDYIRDTSLASQEARQAVLNQLSSGSITMLADSQRRAVTNTLNNLRNRIIQMGNQHDIELEKNIHAWISADGGYNDIDQDGSCAGYEYETWGGTVGAHMDVGNFSFGAAISASYGELTAHSSDRAEADHDIVTLSAFARHQSGRWTQMGILSLGRNEIEMTRNVHDLQAEGDASGHTITAYYEAGYTYSLDEESTQVIQPLVSLMLTSARMGDLTETGSIGNAGLCADTEDYFYGTLGIGARYQLVLAEDVNARLSFLELRAKLVQDFGDETNEATVSFSGAPGHSFVVQGADVGRTGFQFGAGLSVPAGIYTTLFADVDADIRSGATSVSGSVGVRVEF